MKITFSPGSARRSSSATSRPPSPGITMSVSSRSQVWSSASTAVSPSGTMIFVIVPLGKAASDVLNWLVRVLDAAGVGEAALVGHSLGSLAALACAPAVAAIAGLVEP